MCVLYLFEFFAVKFFVLLEIVVFFFIIDGLDYEFSRFMVNSYCGDHLTVKPLSGHSE